MYDTNLGTSLDGFPVDIAMKLFWEALTFNVTASITANFGGLVGTTTISQNQTFNWGVIASDPPTVFDPRSGLITATEALCAIQESPDLFPDLRSHTLFIKDQIVNTIQTRLSFEMSTKELYLIDGILHAPFSVGFQAGTAIIQTGSNFLTQFPPQLLGNSATWNTPWGNTSTPLRGASQGNPIIAGSITITVTAADPEVRYA